MLNAQRKLIETIDADTENRFLKVGDYSIYYITSGSGEPLLLLHGLNIGWGQWYCNIAELSKHFKVYALNFPGSGLSTNLKNKKRKLVSSLSFIE